MKTLPVPNLPGNGDKKPLLCSMRCNRQGGHGVPVPGREPRDDEHHTPAIRHHGRGPPDGRRADPENLRGLPASSLFHKPRHTLMNTSAGPIKKPRRIRRGQETVLSAYCSEGRVYLGVWRHHGLLLLAPPPQPTAAAGSSDGTQQQGAGLGDSG